MITVAIFINGNPIYTRSAVNVTGKPKAVVHRYRLDDGTILTHKRSDGAVVLAKMMLDTIKEV